jgi:CRISPR/Cas system-associated exonuclease Cas4 (RecB family)
MQAQVQANNDDSPTTGSGTLLVVKPEEDGFQVYEAAMPDRIYLVGGSRQQPECTCAKFRWKDPGNPNRPCQHIEAVMRYIGEGQAASQPENLSEHYGNSAPAGSVSGSGGVLSASSASLTLKRSVSPDGRIDSLSVEFALPIAGLRPQEVHDFALRGLDCQEEIVRSFLNEPRSPDTNGNGHDHQSGGNGSGTVPATLRDIGGMQTKWGWRYFINVEANGNSYKLFGNRKELGEQLANAGHGRLSQHINKGKTLNVSCLAVMSLNCVRLLIATRRGDSLMARAQALRLIANARKPAGSHLSYSRVNRYLLCPEQYRLYYVEGMRPRVPSASLEFGQTIHRALARHFQNGENATDVFREIWASQREAKLRYAYRESWDNLNDRGQRLLAKFLLEEIPKLSCVDASERPFELAVSNLDVPFVGVIDLVARVEGVLSVVDFKTSGSAYQDFEVELSDQLTAYRLAEPKAAQSALCVFVKTKEPKIEWFFSQRTGDELTAYLSKVALIGRQIAGGVFYKRPGKWCAQCDYLPICMGDKQRAEETLLTIDLD